MTLQTLPRHIFESILDDVFDDYYSTVPWVLSLRLVNRHLNDEILHGLYHADLMPLHTKLESDSTKKPTGLSLERVVKGFMLRPKSSSDVLNVIRRALRDAALIMSVLLDPSSDDNALRNVPATCIVDNSPSTDIEPTKEPTTTVIAPNSTTSDLDEQFSDDAVWKVCKAYICLLGEKPTFESLDPTWQRDPSSFQKLEDKTGHFWAMLAAVLDGRADVISKAMKACNDRFATEEDQAQLKMHLAAGLLLAAKQGDLEAVKLILTQPAVRISLRIQNIRFSGYNAMEAAIEQNHVDIVRLLLDNGWNFTTLHMDYIRALKAVAGSMSPSSLRHEILTTLLEGSCQQWRHPSITSGLFQELCKQGDLDGCKWVVELLKKETTGDYDWRWNFEDKTNSDNIATTAPNTEEDGDWDPAYTSPDETNSLFQAVKNNHNNVLPFINENKSHFPELANDHIRYLNRCFEYSIKEDKIDTLKALILCIGDVCPQRLFVFAITQNKPDALKLLLPLVDLNKVNDDNSNFWNFSYDGSELYDNLCQLRDYDHPQIFMCDMYTNSPRALKLGTYALLTAIKNLNVPITKWLLELGCEIGTRLAILSPNTIEFKRARIVFPHDMANCDKEDKCKDLTKKLGRRMVMVSLKRISAYNKKRMLERGAWVPEEKTRCLTKSKKWLTGKEVYETGARIITHIQITGTKYWEQSETNDPDECDKVEEEMRQLLKRYHMPDIFVAGGE